jgi:hypothetical protein
MVGKSAAIVAILSAGAVAFWLGRRSSSGDSQPAQTAAASPPVVTRDIPPNDPAGGPPPKPTRALARASAAVDPASAVSRPELAPPIDPASFDETPGERDARHKAIAAHLAEKLGDIPPEKRAKIMALNDEAVDVQRKQRVALMAGSLSQADFDQQQHQAVLVQLDELRAIVTDDEYRKLTGLEPGVDPYDYARTGVGGAQTTVAPAAHVSDESTQHKR